MLTILSTIIVARLLTPADYGVIAMAGPITGLLLLIQNLGLNQATIQARSLSHGQSNAMFWVNVTASAAITALLLAAAPLASWFYQDARAGNIVAASALTVLLNGATQQHSALLSRDLKFGTLSKIDMATSVTTFAVTLVAAYLLRSYWALWLGPFIGTFVNVIAVWRHSPWRPDWKPSYRGSGPLLRFGTSLTGYSLLNFLSNNVDNILIAKKFGAAALGLYDRSYQLMVFPLRTINTPLSRVMLPILARLQDEPDRYRRSFLLAVRALSILILPAVAVAIATNDRLVPFLLGNQWTGAAPIFFWMSMNAFLQPISNAAGWLFTSTGRGGALLRWGLFQSVTALLGFTIGLAWGPEGVAASIFICSLLRMPIYNRWSTKDTPVRSLDLYLMLLLPLIAAAITWTFVHVISEHFSFPTLLTIALPTGYAIAMIVQLTTKDGRDFAHWLARLALSTIRSRKGPIH